VLSLSSVLLGFAVDEIGAVTTYGGEVVEGALPGPLASELVTGMIVTADGLRVLLDPEQVLLRDDAERLRQLLEGTANA
jgi:chemotaxis signal transduction protein